MPCKSILLFLCAFWCLTPQRASAAALAGDMNSAVAYAYFQVGSPADYAPDLSIDAFKAQIGEIKENGYNVISVEELLTAQTNGQALPPKTIILTFESFDAAFVKEVLPILEENDLPFVLFLSPSRLDEAEKAESFPSWDDVKSLMENDKVEIGIVPYRYMHEHDLSVDDLVQDINHSKVRVREKLDIEPLYFSYPFGEFSASYESVVGKAGFSAAFTQTSGVISSSSGRMTLPRFTMTEGFSDIDRFRMTSMALPFPVKSSSFNRVFTDHNPPEVQFVGEGQLSISDLEQMDCFASGIGNVGKKIDGKKVSLVFSEPFEDGKARINCTIPVSSPDNDPDSLRWRWLGFQFIFPE